MGKDITALRKIFFNRISRLTVLCRVADRALNFAQREQEETAADPGLMDIASRWERVWAFEIPENSEEIEVLAELLNVKPWRRFLYRTTSGRDCAHWTRRAANGSTRDALRAGKYPSRQSRWQWL